MRVPIIVLVAVFMGWLMDADRKGGDAGKDGERSFSRLPARG